MGVKSSGGLVERLRVPEGPVHRDHLFTQLHGREVAVHGRRWRLEVYSISDVGDARWIQFGLNGLPRHMLSLKVGRVDGLSSVLRVVSTWLADPLQMTAGVTGAVSSSALRLTSTDAALAR
jgi:hypothetical protein